MIWEPFVLALVLGLLVSAGLYFAFLWPQVEPSQPEPQPEPQPPTPGPGSPETSAPSAVSSTP